MIKRLTLRGFWKKFGKGDSVSEATEAIEKIIYDNSHLSDNTGFKCCQTKKDIYVGDTILFEESLGMGTRVATCEATVRLDDTCEGYYVEGFFMDGGDRIPFQWKLLEDFYSNIRLASGYW